MTVQELEQKIIKKEQDIAKKEKNLVKYTESDLFTSLCDRYFSEPDYRKRDRSELEKYLKENNLRYFPEYYSKRYDLEDAKLTLKKYKKQLETAKDKEKTLSEMPEVLVKFRDDLIRRWDDYDNWKVSAIKEDYKVFDNKFTGNNAYRELYRAMDEKWGRDWYEFKSLRPEEIHKINTKDADNLVMNLINRTIEITGKITDCNYLELNQDNAGYLIINGVIIGEKGKAKVESIYASGPVQRLHVRVLVKECK